MTFLPTSKKEMDKLGWTMADVIFFSGDAYVDHPAFSSGIIGRHLESLGLKVAIVPQPNWRDDLRDFKKLGKPRYFFAVGAGNMDSIVNHYTPQKRLRSDDAYTAGGKNGMRPDYPTIVYTKILKSLYPEVPVIIGGIEASLRRLTHYDYLQDSLKPSILYESGADLLVYGMAEKALSELVTLFRQGQTVESMHHVKQTAYLHHNDKPLKDELSVVLPSHQKCIKDKKQFAESFVQSEKEFNSKKGSVIFQQIYDKTVVINPSFPPPEEAELDKIYDLPFTRKPHFRYKEPVPAFEMIKHSVTIHRGCFGGCSFCTLAAHQSKFISSRSQGSILKELKLITNDSTFKGHVSDLGGPSANMYGMSVHDPLMCIKCSRPSCIYPRLCKNINNSHLPLIELYKKASAIKEIKKITIGSGIRYDLFLTEDNSESQKKGFDTYIKLLIQNHVSGRLKVAPEHTSPEILSLMRKPTFTSFLRFKSIFDKINKDAGLSQQLIPYFISGHPGTHFEDMANLSVEAKKHYLNTEHVQEFTPTPMTLSSVMYYCGFDPYNLNKLHIAKDNSEKAMQKKFFFYYIKENKAAIVQLLKKMKRDDLIKKLY